ncbi:hypothetical protein B0A64_01130 [Flavobacterium araucananum]|uniref:Uncharacterized protein n=1 Tax=Flavobacterium araucananum TaxID=946678 RepID=A0A227PK19_9FLAO|nr:hypothetical protein B0A64_01130 [Flavobacterium araucananum]
MCNSWQKHTQIKNHFNLLNLWQKITAKINRKELAKICAIRGKKHNNELVKICAIRGKPFFKFDKKNF